MIQNGRQRRSLRVDYLYKCYIQFTHVLKNKRICLHPRYGKLQAGEDLPEAKEQGKQQTTSVRGPEVVVSNPS